mmetsp:Transcript_31378/g.22737  ORF Transcript_31378/g.22737 Transcript_31378/m.22737 type:complete len:231 (+) Transcript_31378:692-1384(+)
MLDQLLWVINNITGTGELYCHKVIKKLPNLINCIYDRLQAINKVHLRILENIAWTLGNIGYNNLIEKENYKNAFYLVADILISNRTNKNQSNTVADCLKVLKCLAKGFSDEESISLYASNNQLLEILIGILSGNYGSFQIDDEGTYEHVVIFLGTILGSSDKKVVERLILKGFCDKAAPLLFHQESPKTIVHTLWAYSNIAAMSEFIATIVLNKGLMQRILNLAVDAKLL